MSTDLPREFGLFVSPDPPSDAPEVEHALREIARRPPRPGGYLILELTADHDGHPVSGERRAGRHEASGLIEDTETWCGVISARRMRAIGGL